MGPEDSHGRGTRPTVLDLLKGSGLPQNLQAGGSATMAMVNQPMATGSPQTQVPLWWVHGCVNSLSEAAAGSGGSEVSQLGGRHSSVISGQQGHNRLRQLQLCLTVDNTGASAALLLIQLCGLQGKSPPRVEGSQSRLGKNRVGSLASPAPSYRLLRLCMEKIACK